MIGRALLALLAFVAAAFCALGPIVVWLAVLVQGDELIEDEPPP